MIFFRNYKNIEYVRTVDNHPGPGGAGERGVCCGGAGEQLSGQQVDLVFKISHLMIAELMNEPLL